MPRNERQSGGFGYGGFNRPKAGTNVKPKTQQPRAVRSTQFFWLEMTVPFTSTAGEQKLGITLPQQFPLLIRGAWSNLTSCRVQFLQSAAGVPLSTVEVPILGLAGNSNLVHPMYYWRRPFFLNGNNQLRGTFINDGSEAAGKVEFLCERTDLDINVPVIETQEYRLLLDLGLSGGATGRNRAETQAIEYDILIYGALSTSTGMLVKFTDARQNIAWSRDQIPIGALAGIVGNPEPVIRYATPYYLPRNSTIIADWLNSGAETGKYVEFICERVIH
jgi:hypothetical protein